MIDFFSTDCWWYWWQISGMNQGSSSSFFGFNLIWKQPTPLSLLRNSVNWSERSNKLIRNKTFWKRISNMRYEGKWKEKTVLTLFHGTDCETVSPTCFFYWTTFRKKSVKERKSQLGFPQLSQPVLQKGRNELRISFSCQIRAPPKIQIHRRAIKAPGHSLHLDVYFPTSPHPVQSHF